MTSYTRFLLCIMAAFAMTFMAGCSDSPKAADQPKPLTKEEVRDAIKEASQPNRSNNLQENREIIREQTKGYTPEDEERKKAEAMKAYEEFKKQQALEEKQRQKN